MKLSNNKNAILFLVDGLNPRFLSCYGCAWSETPFFDRLASESILFERSIVETNRPQIAVGALLDSRHPLSLDDSANQGTRNQADHQIWNALRSAGYDLRYISDCNDSIEQWGPRFDSVFRVGDSLLPNQLANEIEETYLASCVAELLQVLPTRTTPSLTVVHLRSLMSTWDAPLYLRSKHRDEEDPDPAQMVVPPNGSSEIGPDEYLDNIHAYAAQLEVLDTCLSVLRHELEQDGILQDSLFLLAGTCGFPLGDRGQVGQTDGYLNGDAIHVPLFIRLPDGSESIPQRNQHLNTQSDWMRWIQIWLADETQALDQIQGGRDYAFAKSEHTRSIWTDQWLLIYQRRFDEEADFEMDPTVRLFVKPEDLWEVNPIEDRCREVVDELSATMDVVESTLAETQTQS